MIKKKLAILLFGLISIYSFSQNLLEDQANWFAYVGQIKMSKKIGIHAEAQFRLDDELKLSRQNLFRVGGVYHINSKVNLALGYGFITTYNSTFDDYFNENRIWQQLIYNHNWKENKNLMNHRLRVEQRFVDRLGIENDNTDVVATHYQNRFRYLNRNLIHLMDFKNSNNTLYGIIQSEVFLNVGKNKINSKFFDQNRFFTGLGVHFKEQTRIELGYMNHYLNLSSGPDLMNHTLSFSILQNLSM
jgi:hypothetical protein